MVKNIYNLLILFFLALALDLFTTSLFIFKNDSVIVELNPLYWLGGVNLLLGGVIMLHLSFIVVMLYLFLRMPHSRLPHLRKFMPEIFVLFITMHILAAYNNILTILLLGDVTTSHVPSIRDILPAYFLLAIILLSVDFVSTRWGVPYIVQKAFTKR